MRITVILIFLLLFCGTVFAQDISADMEKDGITSAFVMKDGKVVFEKYFGKSKAETRQKIYSVTKVVMTTLLGIAIDEKLIKDENEPAAEKSPVTIKQLLTMTSGYNWHEWNNWGEASHKMKESKNWAELFYGRDIKPDAGFNYDSGNAHLISVIISRTAKMNTMDYLKKKLFEPLGIKDFKWVPVDPQGLPYGGSGLELKPSDIAKIGRLYLDNGRYNGKQIVSEAWIKKATATQVKPEAVTKFISGDKTDKNKVADCGYGYFWWVRDGYYFGMGYGGQILAVVPSKHIVAVFTAWNPAQSFFPEKYVKYFIEQP